MSTDQKLRNTIAMQQGQLEESRRQVRHLRGKLETALEVIKFINGICQISVCGPFMPDIKKTTETALAKLEVEK